MMELLLVQLHVGSIILQMPVSGDPWVDHREETCNGQREEQSMDKDFSRDVPWWCEGVNEQAGSLQV